MQKKVVSICTGTACYILGGANLLALEEYLPEELQGKVIVQGSPCLGHCKECGVKSPFATVDGELISSATVQKIVSFLLGR